VLPVVSRGCLLPCRKAAGNVLVIDATKLQTATFLSGLQQQEARDCRSPQGNSL
jgi:hypothetical protein